MTRHKNLVTAYLATNFELFFGRFNTILVQSDSYVTKRQSIKLLGEILLDRANYNVMMAYVESGENLKLCMKLLRDDRKMVQYEGFHVFKVRSPCRSLRGRGALTNPRFLLPTRTSLWLFNVFSSITATGYYDFCPNFWKIALMMINSRTRRVSWFDRLNSCRKSQWIEANLQRSLESTRRLWLETRI